ncbi:exodeoxyribonuclease III [Legionella sp. W05-934-2]|uniref:exodeoxyribonuclease III n=1 Tax=Legionella sp. W05-934-2 TaxID=1198649 RepID=UPI0034630E1B
MRVMTFNANGIRSAAKKGFYDWFSQQDIDLLCIQETKAQLDQINSDPSFFPPGYVCHYASAEKKGYSGTALYSRQKPQKIIDTVEYDIFDEEGRYIQFDFDKFSIVSLYLPSGTSGDHRQSVKMATLDFFATHLQALKNEKRSLIICGDFNIAHKEIDLKNWKANQKNSGFLPEERAWMDYLYHTLGFVDAFRVVNQQPEQYTWWTYRAGAFARNVGWRIDYQVITPDLAHDVKHASIYREQQFSDHAPLTMEYQGEWHAEFS